MAYNSKPFVHVLLDCIKAPGPSPACMCIAQTPDTWAGNPAQSSFDPSMWSSLVSPHPLWFVFRMHATNVHAFNIRVTLYLVILMVWGRVWGRGWVSAAKLHCWCCCPTLFFGLPASIQHFHFPMGFLWLLSCSSTITWSVSLSAAGSGLELHVPFWSDSWSV